MSGPRTFAQNRPRRRILIQLSMAVIYLYLYMWETEVIVTSFGFWGAVPFRVRDVIRTVLR